MRRTTTLVFVLCFVTAAGSTDAQVSARQGEQEKVRFESPMILDLPLTVADPQLWGRGQIRSKNDVALRKYSCDGVSFVDFASTAKRQRDGNVKITFDFVFATERGMDKLASVRFRIMVAEREVVARVRNDIDAEEGKQASGQVTMLVPETVLKADPVPTLQIELKVADNP